jgi:hypothetical protein
LISYTEEQKGISVSEKRALRRISGPKREEVAGGWRKLHNEELRNCASPNIIGVIKSRRMRWAGHVAHMEEMKSTYRKTRKQEIAWEN